MGIPGWVEGKKQGARQNWGVEGCFLAIFTQALLGSHPQLHAHYSSEPATKSLPMANTGSGCCRLGKVRVELSKFLELRRPKCCLLQKVAACGSHHAGCHHLTAINALWWPILPFNRQHKNIKPQKCKTLQCFTGLKEGLEQCLVYRINISRESDSKENSNVKAP